jgi:nucleoside-diphosphate-sugar epimerase
VARNKVLIAGGMGVVGRAAVEHFDSLSDWDIVALSRRTPDFETRAEFLSFDLW